MRGMGNTITTKTGEPLHAESVAYLLEITEAEARVMLAGAELLAAARTAVEHVGTVRIGQGTEAAAAKDSTRAAIAAAGGGE